MNANNPLRVGLLGAGRIGQVHAANIAAHPACELAALSDVAEKAAQKLAAKHGATVAATDAIIADPAIDAVLIATPTDTHADLIEQSVGAGKSVLCEKPIDLDIKRAQVCMEKVKQSAVMLGFNRRFDPDYSQLKARFDAGEIGNAYMLTLTAFDPAPPPIPYIGTSGGLFRDMAIHDFDVAQWIMGEAPVSVFAIGGCLADPAVGKAGDIDTAVAVLKYRDGRISVIRNCRKATYGHDQRIELLGAGGMLRAENVLQSTVQKWDASGLSADKPEHFFLERYAAAYKAEWHAFVQAVAAKKPMPVTLADGVAALAAAEAATRSAQSGKEEPVE